MAQFVYQDYGVLLPGEEFEYKIYLDGVEIEHSKAYGKDFPIVIYPNRVVQQYLHSTFPSNTGVTRDSGAFGECEVTDENENTIFTHRYINGYDGVSDSDMYDYEVLSVPINGHADPRMRIFYSIYDYNGRDVDVTTQ